MTVDKPWHHLNITTDNAISQKGHAYFSGIVKNNTPCVLQTKDIELFNSDWVKQLCECTQNEVSTLVVFYRPPFYQHAAAHIDLNLKHALEAVDSVVTEPAGVNLVYNGANDTSQMVWYHCTEYTEKDVQWAMNHTPYINFDLESLSEMSRCCIGNNVTLVRTDIPHTILMSSEPRLSISVRFKWHGWQDFSWPGIFKQCEPYLRDN